ncbi:carboxypeptidase-like regulatory domain-containing protein [Maribacter halichondriae]|uniref:carboxypeptidase-like regulatory domain-containing protein n=1 Tax=Maribacter halichondriae TaxID=2980554 RepID=UPI00235962DE|nr:carboxypeptidase-like regulatory domain-containing protein [Maribacter sp. Hal144]
MLNHADESNPIIVNLDDQIRVLKNKLNNSSKSTGSNTAEMHLTATAHQESGKLLFSGIVTDGENGLPGVNIQVEDDNHTVSDFDGKFTIEVNEGDLVSLQYVGFSGVALPITNKEKYNLIFKK